MISPLAPTPTLYPLSAYFPLSIIQFYNFMIGIGHKQQKATKIKILAERAEEYNKKYDALIAQGLDPQEVASQLQKEEYEKRHSGNFVQEPYKTTSKINQIGGTVHLGYTEAHKTLTETQALHAPITKIFQAKKSGTESGFNFTKTQQQLFQLHKMKERIQKDHLQENFDINLGEKKSTDYKLHYNDDDKMKDIRGAKDKQYYQRKNELNWYVETYIKTKDSLRKC